MKKIILLFIMALSIISLKGQNPDFLKMLEYGIKAPSGHNTQPWKFKINPNNIEVYPNFDKQLPIVDKNHRELFISLGCAVENICITATELGYNSKIKIIQNDNKSFIRIELKKEILKKDPLFLQIDKRQTNRSVYKSKVITDDIISLFAKLKIESPVSIYFYKNGESSFLKLSEFIYKGNNILFANKKFKNELLDWMRFNSKSVKKSKDGLAYNVLGSPSLPKWLGRPLVKCFLKPKSQNKTERKKLNSSSHLVLISTKENTIENWILAGRALERFWLKCTELGISVAFSNQPCEINSVANELRTQMDINNSFPMLLMRIGYANPMPYSVRKPLQDVLIK